MCSICSDDFTIISTIIDLPKCNHIFHRRCIGRWLTEFKNKCPLCNTDVSDNPIHV
jgi:RING-H2 zinc finger protein RHA1